MEIFVYPAKQWYDVSQRRLPTRILTAQVLNIGFLSCWHDLNIVHKSSKYEYAIVARMYFLVAWALGSLVMVHMAAHLLPRVGAEQCVTIPKI